MAKKSKKKKKSKKAKRHGKGRVPLGILETRHARLGRLIVKRGGTIG